MTYKEAKRLARQWNKSVRIGEPVIFLYKHDDGTVVRATGTAGPNAQVLGKYEPMVAVSTRDPKVTKHNSTYRRRILIHLLNCAALKDLEQEQSAVAAEVDVEPTEPSAATTQQSPTINTDESRS